MGDSSEKLWELTMEVTSSSIDKLNNELSEIVDRFTWDTGSPEDLKRITLLEHSIKLRKNIISWYIINK